MSESKPPASLSPTLLARKGAARPAMRPQWQPLSNYSNEVPLPPAEPLEDLGWNDMGDAPELAADYTLLAGRIWVMVLVVTLLAPVAAFARRGQVNL